MAQYLKDVFAEWVKECDDRFSRLKANEEELNRIFIGIYGLQDELTPEVEDRDVTVRRADLVREVKSLISYAVGCMFGRYSLDVEGLVLASAGGTIDDYLEKVPQPTFMPDEDNVIPVLEDDWFEDDVVERFKKFLKTVYGAETLDENVGFIEDALGCTLRKYFVKDFYKDHVKVYQKRPIYWLYSSPKGSFSALVYLHRYTPSTNGIVLQYLRRYISGLANTIADLQRQVASADLSNRARTLAQTQASKIMAKMQELEAYERDVLYPLATAQIDIDLDDGVKVNYAKLGNALRAL